MAKASFDLGVLLHSKTLEQVVMHGGRGLLISCSLDHDGERAMMSREQLYHEDSTRRRDEPIIPLVARADPTHCHLCSDATACRAADCCVLD